MYILEVQVFVQDPPNIRGFYHVGYMNKVFKIKKEASDFYDLYNPHMRSLNAHNTWNSDWDPKTCLRYIVREFFGEHLSFPSFDSTSVNR